MARKSTASHDIDEVVARSVNFELSIADLARRSERRAWWVAFFAIGITLLLAAGYFYMLPLKQKVPYLIMADAYTGTSTVARLSDDLTHRSITSSDAINRSNVAHFVMARESYDLAMLNLHDWATVQTMSAPAIKAAYTQLYSSANPENLVKIYGKDTAIRVKLLSIVLIGASAGKTPKGATVRLQRNLFNKQSGLTRPLDNKVATLEFVYKTNLEMDDQSRFVNPLGFWVTDYRVDNDYATPPAQEVQATPPPPLQSGSADKRTSPAPGYRQATDPTPSPATPARLPREPFMRAIAQVGRR